MIIHTQTHSTEAVVLLQDEDVVRFQILKVRCVLSLTKRLFN